MQRMKPFLLLLSLALLFPIWVHGQKTQELKTVAYVNCGTDTGKDFLVNGASYSFSKDLTGDAVLRNCHFSKRLIYAFDKMDIEGFYRLSMRFISDQPRKIKILADGNPIHESVSLSSGKEALVEFDLPKKAYAYGQLVLVMEPEMGPNAVVSEIKIASTGEKKLAPLGKQARQDILGAPAHVVEKPTDLEAHLPVYTEKVVSIKGVYKTQISLNGPWRFAPSISEKFPIASDKETWHTITVPGEWAMQGFEVDSAAFAGYKRWFDVPQGWDGQALKLRFDGVSSECSVWLNGEKLGDHLGGMTAFEFDVTHQVKAMGNELVLKVRNESLADMLGSLTQYAAHQLGGITRKVTLFAVPKMHLADLQVETDLDENYTDAVLRLHTKWANENSQKAKGYQARVSIPEKQIIKTFDLADLEGGIVLKKNLEVDVENPEKWTNETPKLYDVFIDLVFEGQEVSRVHKRVGFREIKVSGKRLLVNGQEVKLRGVNRHEAHPLYGRVLNKELWEKDLDLFIQGNCNYIRTSHYPPAEDFLALCDEKGVFVEVEAPVCWVGHHANKNWKVLNYQDEKYFPYMLQANMENIAFNRNHPSILFWSMANESYWNHNFARLLEYVKLADLTRPEAFHDQGYGGFNNQGSTAAIANIHYPGSGGYKQAANMNRPMVYGEYCHLNVYNRRELVTDPGVRNDWAMALLPTWENMYKTEGILGGALWSGIDDIFQMPNGKAVGYGPWGPIDGWRRPKPEYWHMKKIYSPLRVEMIKSDDQGNVTLEIENRYAFTDLRDVIFKWKGDASKGRLNVNCAAGEKAQITLSLKEKDAKGALELTCVDPRGFEADRFVWSLGESENSDFNTPGLISTKLKKRSSEYYIKGKDFECRVNRSTGQITSLKRSGKTVMTGGPVLMVLPLDGGGCYPNHDADIPPFNESCKEWHADKVEAQETKEGVTLKVEGSYDGFKGNYSMTFNANGQIDLEYSFVATGSVNPRQWGMVFHTPKTFDRVFWDRKGLWSSYPKGHIGRTKGEAPLFYEGVPTIANGRVEPTWEYSMDYGALGCNDFRSTRRNIRYAGLKDGEDSRVMVLSDENQHWRSWLEGNEIHFLVAEFVTGGNELFLGGYYAPFRKPIKKGDNLEGKVTLRVFKDENNDAKN